LNKYKFSNAEQNDLWIELDNVIEFFRRFVNIFQIFLIKRQQKWN
jgi:hypothetical protein